VNPVYNKWGITVFHGDCLDVMRGMESNSVHAIVTDPPYGLSDLTVKRITQALTRWLEGDREYIPPGPGGFMSKAWDSFVPPPAVWDECYRILKPGGHMLVFAGTRTVDLMGISIRLAGFEYRDSIGAPLLAWTFGSGFPKSLDISATIDKSYGAVRNATGVRNPRCAYYPEPCLGHNDAGKSQSGMTYHRDKVAAVTEAAKQWDGWGTALKPSWEPIICVQKPFNMVPLWEQACLAQHSLGALLWLSTSSAKRAELSSPSSPHALPEGACASALAAAVLAPLLDESAQTATFSSQALESTCLNIASSWSAILAALSSPMRTCTTSTESSTTIALRTLNSLLAPLTSLSTMPKCGCLLDGQPSLAPNAGAASSDEWAKWRCTLSVSAHESVIEGIALAALNVLASIVADLSSGLAAASTAHPSATTLRCGDNSNENGAGTAELSSILAAAVDGTVRAAAPGSLHSVGSRPSWEPIIMVRKPVEGTIAGNVLAHGCGALNIAATRVGTEPRVNNAGSPSSLQRVSRVEHGYRDNLTNCVGEASAVSGRWPPNAVFTHHPSCAETACVEGCAVAELDKQSGISVTSKPSAAIAYGAHGQNGDNAVFGKGLHSSTPNVAPYGDTGGASRYFPCFRWEAKAPTAERPKVNGESHSTVKPLSLMRHLVTLVTPPDGTVLDCFAGTGTTGQACRAEGFKAILIEKEPDYIPLIKARLEALPKTEAGDADKPTAAQQGDLFDLLGGAS
jgi:DNA modification methylase